LGKYTFLFSTKQIKNCAAQVVEAILSKFTDRSCTVHIFGHCFASAICIDASRKLIEEKWTGDIYCITFGFPLVGDEAYALWDGWKAHNLHLRNFFCDSDPMCNFTLRDRISEYYYAGPNLFVFNSISRDVAVVESDKVRTIFKPTPILPDDITNRLVFHHVSFYLECVHKMQTNLKENPTAVPNELGLL